MNGTLIKGMYRKIFFIRKDWSCRMTKLKISTETFPTVFQTDVSGILKIDRLQVNNNRETAEYSRFKAQLKRAVDSVEAPEYLIDAIKTAIRS